MIVFLLATLLLILGYVVYGLIIEKILGINPKNPTPAQTLTDGVDFVPLSPRKIFLIQFLNIAGLGPVFGAILGALYGPICLLWIVLGSIFAGGVHDMLAGVISIRNAGSTMTALVQKYFGKTFHAFFLTLMVLLLTLIGSIFAQTPAKLLAGMTQIPFVGWLSIIFGYYFLATLLPIDKIIGRFYPIFGACLIISTLLLLGVLFTRGIDFYPDLHTLNQNPNDKPIFPLMFITIACGALSGFHATQSPMMARCITNEKYSRPIFYGAMILEGFIALIWATLGIAFYHGTEGLNNALGGTGDAGVVVSQVSKSFLGEFGGLLAILSVVFLAITTGDTALRSARLSLADFLKVDQKNMIKRLIFSAIILGIATIMAFINLDKIWLYFGWVNQLLASIMLWVGALYLREKRK
ncbi:MAG: carbon starvation CstA family protein, partial [Pseudomonadota bacterium]|nr:carbon starvation CstA family protein [Pseudomonadota bacterium]